MTTDKKTFTKKPTDIYSSVTDSIISLIESGKKGGVINWRRNGLASGLPANFKSKKAYSGVNVLILWAASASAGYQSNYWLTFNQAKEMGAFIRKGEKGTAICFYKMIERQHEESGEAEKIPMLKTFVVFNVDQIEGLNIEAEEPAAEISIFEQNELAENILIKSGADIHEEGDKAFYRISTDEIYLPTRDRFETEHHFYAVGLHELTHWTAAKHRLAREFSGRFGNEAYAFEELIAELGAAFLCAEVGIVSATLEGHASYLDNWLEVLKKDKKAIFTAASQATKAANYIMSLACPERTQQAENSEEAA